VTQNRKKFDNITAFRCVDLENRSFICWTEESTCAAHWYIIGAYVQIEAD